MSNRHIKILFSSIIAIYISLVVFNNITDYNSNFQFVSMVSSMKDTFDIAKNGWRSMDNPILHHILYCFIIVWEISIAFFLWKGAYQMWRQKDNSTAYFQQAKKSTTTGLVLGIVLWFLAFVAVAGEWFLMWQSETWNAQDNAFFLSIVFLLFLIFHQTEEKEVQSQ